MMCLYLSMYSISLSLLSLAVVSYLYIFRCLSSFFFFFIAFIFYIFFFFFQAEDGIRDLIVTGVQTCALPIFQSDGSPCPVLYEPAMGRLAIPLDWRWPELYERVLVLASGQLPVHRNPWLIYEDRKSVV